MAEGGLAAIGTLKGKLSGEGTVSGKLTNVGALKGKLSIPSTLSPDFYDGDYVIDPSFEQQVLETRNKMMLNDVTVNEIGVSRVTNPSGGITVYIGGVINA